jgi:molecular chaperone HscB
MTAPTQTETACWSCGVPHAGGHFCAACGKIQPLPRGTDYFALFGLPQKLWLDAAELEKLFHQMSWKLHPDNFVRASEYERELSLERSSQLNDAYRALREPVSRVEYLLAHAGMRKEGAAKQQAPPELLEEVFELNESLDELRSARASSNDGAELAALKQRLSGEEKKFEEKLHEVDEELMRIAKDWDTAIDASADESKRKLLMSQMNDVLNRRSYIRNLVANVHKELAEA